MSAALPAPSPSAKHASFTSIARIRPLTSPGASPTHSAPRPSVAKKRSAAAAAAGDVEGPRVSSAGAPSSSGAASTKPAAVPPGSCAASGAASHSSSCGPPCSGGPSSVAPQSTIRCGQLALRLLRRGRVPAGRRGLVEQDRGDRLLARDHDEPVAAARRGRVRVRRAARRIRVPAAPGLASVAAARRHPRGERRRAPARLGGLVVERARDRVADVDPDEVHQLERAHPEPERAAADAVDLLGGGEPLLDDPQRLERERAVAAVDQEARPVGGLDHVLAQRLAERAGAGERLRAALRAGHQLDEAHPRHGVEEVQADHALGPGHAGRDRRDQQRRGVRRQDRVGRDGLRERGEQRPLDLEHLGRGLDHHVARREPAELRGPLDALDAVARRGVRVVQEHAQAGVARGRRDPRAHRPRSGDPDDHRARTLRA